MIVAGTGHRPDKLGGYGTYIAQKLQNLAIDWLKNNQPERVISGMALGWDIALARGAYYSGIPFDAYVPFAGQDSRWPHESRENYAWTISKARKVVIVCEGGYAAWKMQKRNEAMVDNCDTVLALWNGDQSGGTANCISYARAKGKPIVNLWKEFTT